MPFSVRSVGALLPAALLLAAGCADDELTLRDAYGVYALEMPPEALAAGYSDTLFLENQSPVDGPRGGGGLKETYLVRRAGAPADAAPDSLAVRERWVNFDVKGRDVILFVPCEPAVSCQGGDSFRGPLDGDRLTLHPAPQSSYPSRHYRRVPR